MHLVREEEGDTDLVKDSAQRVGVKVKVDAECLDDIRRARLRRRGTVTVLDERNPHRGEHDGGHRRNVNGLVPVSARTHDVESATRQLDVCRVILHAISQAVDLIDRGALDGHRGQEGCETRLAELAAHDLVHQPVGLAVVEALAGGEGGNDRRPLLRGHHLAPRSTSATVS